MYTHLIPFENDGSLSYQVLNYCSVQDKYQWTKSLTEIVCG